MKVLFDQGTPLPLRRLLIGHEVRTAVERGWGALTNGDLLAAADAAGFEAIVTTDKNIRHQQNLTGRRLGVVVLPTTDWSRIRLHASRVASALAGVRPGDIVDVSFDT